MDEQSHTKQPSEIYGSGRSHEAGSSGIADQMDQGSQSIGQSGEGVAGPATQDNDHTSGLASGGGRPEQDTAGQSHPGQPATDRDGRHAGTVDSLDGDRLKPRQG